MDNTYHLSPQLRVPFNAANFLGVTTTMTLLNPLLGGIFFLLMLAGGMLVQKKPKPEPVEPQRNEDAEEKISDDTKGGPGLKAPAGTAPFPGPAITAAEGRSLGRDPDYGRMRVHPNLKRG
jgi:hypothetical protein